MLVADRLGLPFIYVRPEVKSHGRQNQIEGNIASGKSVKVVIEDLISTGKSSLNAVNALENAKVNVLGMIAIFSYGFDIAEKNFNNAKIKLNTLSNYKNLLALAKETTIFLKDHDVLKLWNSNPSEWENNLKCTMQINSSKVTVNNSALETHSFLSDANNFEKLMPESISKFEAYDATKFLFALKGMPEIALKQALLPITILNLLLVEVKLISL